MGKISLKLIMSGIVLFSLISLFSLVSACDEAEMQSAEMQTMMTGAATGISNIGILESLGLIKELLIVITLIFLIIYLIKLIGKK